MSGDLPAAESAAAVYKWGLGYDDETYHIEPNSTVIEALGDWKAGKSPDYASIWAEAVRSDAPGELLSVHITIEEAEMASSAAHEELANELFLIDFGFYGFGCLPEMMPFDGDAPLADRHEDLTRLEQWCSTNGIGMPSLDLDEPGVRDACLSIIERSEDGNMHRYFLEDQPLVEAFAADMVIDRLKAEARRADVGSLVASVMCELTFVGPAPAPVQPNPPKRGFFQRRFGQ